MIVDRYLSNADDDGYIERTAVRLRAMTAGTSRFVETDPAVIRERLTRSNRLAETRAHLGESVA